MKNRIVDLVFAFVVATQAFGCAATHRVAVRAEHTLEAGSDAWDDHTSRVVAVCRAKNLATQDERRECVDETFTLDKDVVKPAVIAAVLALRAYWIGVAADESPRDLKLYIRNFAEAVKDLPPEFFAGLQRIVR